MMKSINEQIEQLTIDHNLILLNVKPLVNRRLTFKVKTKEVVDRPCKKLKEDINKLECLLIKDKFNFNFYMGKKVDNCSYYEINLQVNEKYDNGIRNSKYIEGQFLNLIEKNNIITIEDLINFTLPIYTSISKNAHIVKDRKIKNELRGIKKMFLRKIYELSFFDSISKQKSYMDDNLILFQKNGFSFHTREIQTLFLNTTDLPLMNKIYEKKEYKNYNEIKNFKLFRHLFNPTNLIFLKK